MKEISLSFTPDELLILLRQSFIGEYVLSSDTESISEDRNNVLQKIIKIIRSNKLIDGIEFDELYEQYMIPLNLEEELVNKIDEYNEDIFLDGLVDELIANEMSNRYSPRIIANMSEEKYEKESSKIEEKVMAEFEKNGYKNITIKYET
jgi:hypothetical protein